MGIAFSLLRRRTANGTLSPEEAIESDHPSPVTGDTHLCFGLLAFLSPITSTNLILNRPGKIGRTP